MALTETETLALLDSIEEGKRRGSVWDNPEVVATYAAYRKIENLFSILREPAQSSNDECDFLDAPTQIDRFQVRSVIGEGGFATVYLAFDPKLERHVAIKVPRANAFASIEDTSRFLGEAKLTAGLNHPGIVTVHDVKQVDERVVIVMEYVEGRTMEAWLTELSEVRKARGIWPRPSSEQIVWFFAQLADALHYAHRKGFIHRDLKPSNVLIDERGNPHIADFGLAVPISSLRKLGDHIAGTPAYMSPEQVSGKVGELDARTDIWSLGVIMYELLSGRRPFRDTPLEACFKDIQKWEPDSIGYGDLERICLQAMSKNVGSRFRSAYEMAEQLRSIDSRKQPKLSYKIATLLVFAVLVMTALLLYSLKDHETLSSKKSLDHIDSSGRPDTVGTSKPEARPNLESENSSPFAVDSIKVIAGQQTELKPLLPLPNSKSLVSNDPGGADAKRAMEDPVQPRLRKGQLLPKWISSPLGGTHRSPAIACHADGTAVIVWQGTTPERAGWDIYARTYQQNASPVNNPFLVNTTVDGDQESPSVAMGENGDFVIAWMSHGQDSDSSPGVYAQRYSNEGTSVGPEFRMNSHEPGIQFGPVVAIRADGILAAAWASVHQVAGHDVFATYFDREGGRIGSEFRVNTNTRFNQSNPSIAVLADGSCVIAYESEKGDNALYDIFLQCIGETGDLRGAGIRVNTHTQISPSWGKRNPDIASNGADQVVVVWADNHDRTPQDGDSWGVFGQAFTIDCVPIGTEFQVNQTTKGAQSHPAVAMLSGGGFIVVWLSDDQGKNRAIFMRRYDSGGVPMTPEIPVVIDRMSTSVACSAVGQSLVIAWAAGDENGEESIFGMSIAIRN